MKVFRDGKEVKNASVSYFAGGQPAHVEIDGVNYDPAAFEFAEDAPVKKTRQSKPASKKNDSVMTTENLTSKG